MSSLFTQGCACYDSKDYNGALSAFNRAIARSKDPGVQLLDKRAACHVKMGNLMEALKDAKATVAASTTDPTGYLRAGAVLVKMKKQQTALQVYARGLANVKPVGQAYTALRTYHDRLSDTISPFNRIDPMTRLPPELAEMVLGHLSFRQRINACRVSKEWSIFIRSCPDLWLHLDFSGAKKTVRNTFISKAINAGRSKIKAVSLHRVQDVNKTVDALFRHCRLEELNLLGMGLLGASFSDNFTSRTRTASLRTLRLRQGTELGQGEMVRLLPWCLPGLSTFECTGPKFPDLGPFGLHDTCKRLQDLSISGKRLSSLQPLLKSMPALRRLRARCDMLGLGLDMRDLQCLEDLLIVTGRSTTEQITLPRSLKSLGFYETGGDSAPQWFTSDNVSEDEGSTYLPNLESLQYGYLSSMTKLSHMLRFLTPTAEDYASDSGMSKATSAAKIHTLAINGADCSNADQMQVLFEHPRLAELQHLDLSFAIDLMISDSLRERCKKLKVLRLNAIPYLTGVHLKALVGPNLERLSVCDCSAVGQDAIEWVRSLGVQVDRQSKGKHFGESYGRA